MILGKEVEKWPGRIMQEIKDTQNSTGSVREKSSTTENLFGKWVTGFYFCVDAHTHEDWPH